jgi:alkanesulfonate monooxygenase SsuD/methylene tetrahydromethanopterin reductase-like flavin-dependent oxidoreductase (luciferase family)
MKVSYFETARYTPPPSPDGRIMEWPVPPDLSEPEGGSDAYNAMLERDRHIEECGFDWISFSEHHYSPRILTPNPILSATFIAARLNRINVAVLGPIVPQVNPVRIAEEFAMLDNLSGGRLRVGLLRGTTNELLTYSLKPQEARDRTTEGMELILKAWTEPQPFGWQGRHYQFRTVSVWPRPLQKPYPPTYALGTSKESCEFAAKHHLGLGASFAPYDLVCRATAYYRDQCEEYGWEPEPEQIIYRANILLENSDEEADAALSRQRSGGAPFPVRPAVGAALMQLDQRNVAGVPREGNIGGSLLTQFHGSPDTVVEQVKRASDEVGCGVIDLGFNVSASNKGPDALLRTIELFGDKVLPRVRDV